jgi:hypothetical protein
MSHASCPSAVAQNRCGASKGAGVGGAGVGGTGVGTAKAEAMRAVRAVNFISLVEFYRYSAGVRRPFSYTNKGTARFVGCIEDV